MKVFGHRGACGYVPENTIESFVTAFNMGADAVELDVVPTRDKKLLVRHDNDLSPTTNVSELDAFGDRMRIGYSDGSFISDGWLIEDFNAEELLKVRARERYPTVRQESAKHNDLYNVPLFDEVLSDTRLEGKHLIVELKHAEYYRGIGLDPVEMLEKEIAPYLAKGLQVSIESFDLLTCSRLHKTFPGTEIIFILDGPHWSKYVAAGGDKLTLFAALSSAGVRSVALGFDVAFEVAGYMQLGDEKVQLIELNRPTGALETIKDAGFSCYGFTARAESGLYVTEEYFQLLAKTEFDGIFCDQPDLMVAALGKVNEAV